VLYFLLAGLLGVCSGTGSGGSRSAPLPAGRVRTGISSFWARAFLLLEVQNISKAAVVLGNTWLVNAVVISGVLAMILLANLVRLLPALAAKGGWLRTDRRLPGLVLHRPVAICLPALRTEGDDRRRIDRSADVLQRLIFIHSFAHARRKTWRWWN